MKYNEYLVEFANRFMNETEEDEIARRIKGVRDKYFDGDIESAEDLLGFVNKSIERLMKADGLSPEEAVKAMHKIITDGIKDEMADDRMLKNYDRTQQLKADAEERMDRAGLSYDDE